MAGSRCGKRVVPVALVGLGDRKRWQGWGRGVGPLVVGGGPVCLISPTALG